MPIKIFLTGGGTIGSVTPLLAAAEHLDKTQLLWLGTKTGPERELIAPSGIKFKAIFSGKFRRYFSLENFLDLFRLMFAFFQACGLVYKYRPEVIVSAGGFVGVPVIWAGWLFGKKIYIHQEDVTPGLSNKLVFLLAHKRTKAFNLENFPGAWIGNPVRDLTPKTRQFIFGADKPVVLIMGGGTGAQAINDLVSADLLKFCQVLHLTGKGKSSLKLKHPDYYHYDFLTEAMGEALVRADLVVGRAGLGTLSELAALGKPSIIIPIPGTHQEANANFFAERQAIILLKQMDLTPEKFTQIIKETLADDNLLERLSKNINKLHHPDAAKLMSENIKSLLKHA